MWQLIFFAPSIGGAFILFAVTALTAVIVTPMAGEIMFFGLLVAAFLQPQRHMLLGYILCAIRTFSFLFLLIWLLFYRGMHLQGAAVLVMIFICAAVGGAAQLRIRSLRGHGIF
jgi:hypothetical protein